MPKYELMYILASSVSDDQVPAITDQIKKFVESFGGTDITETELGKKKLAYPIKKTRNGYYVVVNFDMEAQKVNELDAKIRTQTGTIIRHLLVNLDEHLERLAKDAVEQAKLSKRPEVETADTERLAKAAPAPIKEERKTEAPVEMSTEELDKKIEEALTEDLLK